MTLPTTDAMTMDELIQELRKKLGATNGPVNLSWNTTTKLIAALEKASMDTERQAITIMFEAYIKLKDFGWRNAIYCPKDNTLFDAIEPGSTGIQKCQYMGDWPKGGWWASEAGDLWPSRPCLFRLIPATDRQERK